MPDILHQPYWLTMGPLLVVSVTAFVVMILEFIFLHGNRRWLVWPSLLGTLVAMVPAVQHFAAKPTAALNTMLVDGFASVFSLLILISAALILLFSYAYSARQPLAAEHTYLILFGVAGALAMASAFDLITLYVGLELLSVASYVLIAVRKKSVRSVEGGVKYLIMGSVGSAALLYGMSFIYGISGTTNLVELGQHGSELYQQYPAIVLLGFILMLCGMGFKLSLVPFHMWTPDAYDGAPSPISSFLATLSKTAAFAMLLRMLLFIFNGVTSDVFYWAGILAAVTMLVGNLIALPQRNMKRLLAFSSIAQAGYALIPLALIGPNYTDWTGLFDSLVFYLFAYTFMTIGAFAVVSVVARARKTHTDDALQGLFQQSPWLAGALTVFLLSLAGMPLTGGFLGKFYIFVETIHFQAVWLGILLFVTSIISFYYYLGWVRQMFRKDLDTRGEAAVIQTHPVMNLLLGLCIAGTLALGIVPATLLHPLQWVQWF
ncbi:NADH-quinone oxidoreductase subunit N [Alicyclobacillus herbarius]|uniref:NADH-quinone oxidoreductase subunit N n=1 Tax=Alicyclobacillus herbarius TaxID=122960 RepID=UPI000417367D|nr:NADH-quinone oxidoreductase subunit N [Alicyclobacillus herbarius]